MKGSDVSTISRISKIVWSISNPLSLTNTERILSEIFPEKCKATNYRWRIKLIVKDLGSAFNFNFYLFQCTENGKRIRVNTNFIILLQILDENQHLYKSVEYASKLSTDHNFELSIKYPNIREFTKNMTARVRVTETHPKQPEIIYSPVLHCVTNPELIKVIESSRTQSLEPIFNMRTKPELGDRETQTEVPKAFNRETQTEKAEEDFLVHPYSTLLLKEMFNHKIGTDVNIVTNRKVHRCHQFILIAAVPKFREYFEKNKSKTIDLSECCESETVDDFLRYIYLRETTRLDVTARELLNLARQYDMRDLMAKCREQLLINYYKKLQIA